MTDHTTRTADELEARIADLRGKIGELRASVESSFLGQRAVVDHLLYALFAGGHVLLEGAPGLGKTTLVKGLARSLALDFQRIQFTPDLMPADILGARILEETESGKHVFRFEKGPLFANVVLADEINRATPRTQSALLEAMQERQVTVYGETFPLDDPFVVIATQNPIEMEGTYPLPEAQLDRFICEIELDAPDQRALVEILEATTGAPRPEPEAVLHKEDVRAIRSLVREIPASSDVVALVARLVRATSPSDESSPDRVKRLLRFGASPRGGQAILMLAKARALLGGRPWVSVDDVTEIAPAALRHRLVYGYEGEASGVHADELIVEALERVR